MKLMFSQDWLDRASVKIGVNWSCLAQFHQLARLQATLRRLYRNFPNHRRREKCSVADGLC